MLRIATKLTVNASKQAPCVLRGTFIVVTNNGTLQLSKPSLHDQTKSNFSSGKQKLQARRPGHEYREKGGKKGGHHNAAKFGVPFVAALVGIGGAYHEKTQKALKHDAVKSIETIDESKEVDVEDMVRRHPMMPLQEFRQGQPERTWVAFDEGIYDVTEFLEAHPGGPARIMMVQGQDLAKFWNIYQLHDRSHILKLLEEYKIGKLTSADYKKVSEETIFSNSYEFDPIRTAAAEGRLRIPSERPWNSEPKNLGELVQTFLTPNDIFFVRNHNPVPVIKEDEYELEIEPNLAAGIVGKKFKLADLKKLPRYEMISALQCAGNRQEDYVTEDRPLYVAPHWRNGAIGCAKWAGVKVRDVLRECGMDVDNIALGKKPANAKVANFIAYDSDETGVQYAGVVPLDKIIDPMGDAILAYEMNGETLPRDHGYPIRLLAPGTAGCRNVKWVQAIEVSAEPSELDSGGKLDRHLAPDISWDLHREHAAQPAERKHHDPCAMRDVLTDQSPVIQTLPVQSVICVPGNREVICARREKTVTVKGVAWSGAGRGICRVEVSVDNGKTFTAAKLKRGEENYSPPPELGLGRNYAWTQWEIKVPIPEDLREQLNRGKVADLEICAKAIDGDFNVQPEKMRHGWNVLGVCVNHWSRIQIKLDPNLPPGKVIPAPATPKPGDPYWGDGSINKP